GGSRRFGSNGEGMTRAGRTFASPTGVRSRAAGTAALQISQPLLSTIPSQLSTNKKAGRPQEQATGFRNRFFVDQAVALALSSRAAEALPARAAKAASSFTARSERTLRSS